MSRKSPLVLQGRGCRLDLTLPRIMGVLNVTPDSFSDGGAYLTPRQALTQALQLVAEGADILDVGGESTRPGSAPVSEQEELERVIPVIEMVRAETDIPISVDTTKSAVAREALQSGANFVNDISGLQFDSAMAAVAGEAGAGLFLMHTSGTPQEMQKRTDYRDLLKEVSDYLRQSIDLALSAGVSQDALSVDPGIGFGKSVEGNLTLLNRIDELHELGCPILLGTSRKSFIGRILDRDDPRQRVAGTLATVALGVEKGVRIFRVHDVRAAKDAALVAWAICQERLA